MFKFIPFILVSLLINGCSPLVIGTAEVSGVSLFHDRRSFAGITHDEQIESAVTIELNLNNDIRKRTHFNVTSFNGVVLITGEVPSKILGHQMTAIAKKIPRVTRVQNQMILALPTDFSTRANDSLITSKVKTKFSTSKDMPGFDTTRIKVVTEDSRVYLMGIVYRSEGQIASEHARKISGVKQVVKVFEYL